MSNINLPPALRLCCASVLGALAVTSCSTVPQGYERPVDRTDDFGLNDGATYDERGFDDGYDDDAYGRDARSRRRDRSRRPRSPKFEFQFIYSDQELDELEIDLPGTTATVDFLGLDRRRAELRFGFGPEQARGRFFLFGESFGDDVGPAQLGWSEELDVFGFGGGMSGAPMVGQDPEDPNVPRIVIPYEWDLSLAYGEEDDDNFAVGYAEVRASLGLGIEWFGLRPHGGVQVSGISGAFDNDTNNIIDESEFSGFNLGVYGEVRFNPPNTPLLMRVRAVGGDIDSVEFGFGVNV